MSHIWWKSDCWKNSLSFMKFSWICKPIPSYFHCVLQEHKPINIAKNMILSSYFVTFEHKKKILFIVHSFIYPKEKYLIFCLFSGTRNIWFIWICRKFSFSYIFLERRRSVAKNRWTIRSPACSLQTYIQEHPLFLHLRMETFNNFAISKIISIYNTIIFVLSLVFNELF